MISPIGLAAGGIGGGLGLMALLNKEKGESLSSYPEPSRLEQVVGKEPHRMEVSDKSFKEVKSLLDGSELDVGKYFNSDAYKEWLSTSWKEEDNDFLRILISKTAESYKNNKPKFVPKSSWNEEYMENYRKIISLASDKEGAPKPAEIHNKLREYYYGKKDNRKDQFGHGTSIAPSGDPEFLGVKKEDVVRY